MGLIPGVVQILRVRSNLEANQCELSDNKILVQQDCKTAKRGQNTENDAVRMIARCNSRSSRV